MTPDQINTFQSVAGVTPDTLEFTLRSFIGGAIFVWALWMAVSCLYQLRKERASFVDIKMRLLRVCLVIMVCLVLIGR